MNKINFINVIVSILLILAGMSFCLYVILTSAWDDCYVLFFIIGAILIAYGTIRMYLTNRASSEF